MREREALPYERQRLLPALRVQRNGGQRRERSGDPVVPVIHREPRERIVEFAPSEVQVARRQGRSAEVEAGYTTGTAQASRVAERERGGESLAGLLRLAAPEQRAPQSGKHLSFSIFGSPSSSASSRHSRDHRSADGHSPWSDATPGDFDAGLVGVVVNPRQPGDNAA